MKHIPFFVVIGAGSIAKRHIRNIKLLWPTTNVACISSSKRKVTKEEVGADIIYESIQEAIEAGIELAIIASPAPFHLEHAMDFLSENIPVLIEKPLTNTVDNFDKINSFFLPYQNKIEIAYNFRYLESALKIKHYLANHLIGPICTVICEVGQYLPHWRPNLDYRKNVSAQKKLGGGALLELSHELDYLLWLFGTFDSVFCQVKNSGHLDIDVEDTVDAILQQKNGLIVNLHMDFLQHTPTRFCKMIGTLGTLKWDIGNNQILFYDTSGGSQLLYDQPNYDRNQMYLLELQHFLQVANGQVLPKVSMKEALQVMYLIEGMRKSSGSQQVISFKGL